MSRTRSRVPATCTCSKTRHEHGTRWMYQTHECGCDPCFDANTIYRRARGNRAESMKQTSPAPAQLVEGLFVAVFPYHGGLSPQRLRRILRMEVARLAAAQDVWLLSGDLRVRIDRTGAGVFVSVAVPAETDYPVGEVRVRAAELAWQHEQAHPFLAHRITQQLEEVAA